MQTQHYYTNTLKRGLITIPKKARTHLGIDEGTSLKITVESRRLIIEPQAPVLAPYRVYTPDEITEFLADDTTQAQV